VPRDLVRVKETSPKKTKDTAISAGTKVEARYKGKTKYYAGKIAKAHMDDLIRVLSKPDDDDVMDLKVGTIVEAKYKGKTYYPGKISRVHSDDTFDVDYDDGEIEKRVKRELIRVKSKSPKKPSDSLNVGTKIEAKYKGRTFYPGKIAKVHLGGTYDIDYDDGEVEKRVNRDFIRVKESEDNNEETFDIGTEVDVKQKDKTFQSGEIIKKHSDGSYDIEYNNGKIEKRVENDRIKLKAKKNLTYKVGDIVDAQYKGQSKYYRGKVAKVHQDGSCDINYDDGEAEKRVDPKYIRQVEKESDSSDDDSKISLKVGNCVMARTTDLSKYRSGRILRIHSNDTYDIEFNAGDTEKRVKKQWIRLSKEKTFRVGQKVSTKHKSKQFRGKISRVHNDNTYDIESTQGDTLKRIESDKITEESDSSPSENEPNTRYEKGDLVLVTEKDGKSTKGSILKFHESDSTYDIQLGNGTKLTRVLAKHISKMTEVSSEEEKPKPPVRRFKFKRGQPIESQWHRQKKGWARGIILAKQIDGTYTIRYKDGSIADNAPESTIRSVPESSDEEDKPPPPALTLLDQRFYLQQLLLTLTEEGIILPKDSDEKKTKKTKKKQNKSENDDSKATSDSDSDSNSKERKKSNDTDESGEDDESKKTNDEDIVPNESELEDSALTEKELILLFGSPFMKKCHDIFARYDKHETGKLTIRQAEFAIQGLRIAHNPQRISIHLVRFQPLNFVEFMIAFAYVTYCDCKCLIQEQMEMETIHASRFASKNEHKRQVQLWQAKLGFRVFENLTQTFQQQATMYANLPHVTVEQATGIIAQVGRHLVPKKPIALYWQQVHLLPHHLLSLSEVCCVFYQLYGSFDSVQEQIRIEGLMELRPVAFVAACMFSNGDDCSHNEVVRRLSMGRLPAQVDMIYRVKDIFETLCDERQYLSIAHVETLLKSLSLSTDQISQMLLLFKHQTNVSLVEVFAILGHTLVDNLESIPTIANAVNRLRLRESQHDVNKVLNVCKTLLQNILRFPNNREYWRIRSDTPAFQHKIGRFRGGIALLEAIHFVAFNDTHYELRGSKSANGSKVHTLSSATLNLLKESLETIEQEIAQLEGGASVRDAVQESLQHHSVQEIRSALELLLIYIGNILKHPKDSKYWKIRSQNKVFAEKIGCLTNAMSLMQVIGFEHIDTSQGGVYELWNSANMKVDSNTTPLAHFKFPSLTEHVERHLWRVQQDIELLLNEGNKELIQPLLAPEEKIKIDHRDFPYGLQTITLFGKSDVQALQVEMIRSVFQSMDSTHRGYLSIVDIQHFLVQIPGISLTPEFVIDFLDLDKNGQISFEEFVASFGPLLDHPFTLYPSHIDQGLSLCETVSIKIGILRFHCTVQISRSIITIVLEFIDTFLKSPTDRKTWRKPLPANSPLILHSDGCKELLKVLVMEISATKSKAVPIIPNPHPETSKEHEEQVEMEKKRIEEVNAKEPQYSLTFSRIDKKNSVINRLATLRGVILGHFWGMHHLSIADIGSTTRGLIHYLTTTCHELPQWINVIEEMQQLLSNMVANPQDPSYRKILVSTSGYMTKVGNVPQAIEWFIAMGYHEGNRGELEYPTTGDWKSNINARLLELDVTLGYLKHQNKPTDTNGEINTTLANTVAQIQDVKAKKLLLAYEKKARFALVEKERVKKQNAQLLKQIQKMNTQSKGKSEKTPKPIVKPKYTSNVKARPSTAGSNKSKKSPTRKPQDIARPKTDQFRRGRTTSSKGTTTVVLAQDTMAGDNTVQLHGNIVVQVNQFYKLRFGFGLATEEVRSIVLVNHSQLSNESTVYLASSLRYAHKKDDQILLIPTKSKQTQHYDLLVFTTNCDVLYNRL
ncbi:hypothetical protein THRCLA_22229, partial [Thraustotheca clavata]